MFTNSLPVAATGAETNLLAPHFSRPTTRDDAPLRRLYLAGLTVTAANLRVITHATGSEVNEFMLEGGEVGWTKPLAPCHTFSEEERRERLLRTFRDLRELGFNPRDLEPIHHAAWATLTVSSPQGVTVTDRFGVQLISEFDEVDTALVVPLDLLATVLTQLYNGIHAADDEHVDPDWLQYGAGEKWIALAAEFSSALRI